MANEPTERHRSSCPRCGARVHLRLRDLFPSGDRHRVLKCSACGGHYDLSDGCRIASMMAGLVAMGPGILLFSRVVRAGHGTKLSLLAGTSVVALAFGVSAVLVALLTLRLVPKP